MHDWHYGSIRGRRSLRLVVVAAVTGIAVLVAIAAAHSSKEAAREVTLRVVVSGRAKVVAEPGGRVCRTRCVWRYEQGKDVRLRVTPARGVRFLGWQGDCRGKRCHPSLAASKRVIARFAQAGDRGLQSWSFHTPCRPIKTTIAEIVGSRLSPTGGPAEEGGGFKPHLRGPAQQHLLNPPCRLGGKGIFVELDDVAISGDVDHVQADGDVTTHVFDTRRPDIKNPYFKTVQLELDGTWFRAGLALPDFPAQPARIDVQGFVFWDTVHLYDEWHDYSGWELHPVSAWLPTMRGAR